MLVALVALNLYCTPFDVFDYMGVDQTQLRLDDRLQATGQVIQATADAAALATSISVTALQYPLLKGSVLEFDGGGALAVAEAILSATAKTGDTVLTVSPLTLPVSALGKANDNGVNLAFGARLLKGCQYGTARVKDYCCGRYNDSDLQTAWSPNRWATTIAAHWVCRRRGNAIPKSLADDYEETMEELKATQRGALNISDIGTRTAGWPFISNVTRDLSYTYTQIRVEQQISEGTPTQYGQFVDWNSLIYLEW